jgi:hypothetical protein
VHSLNQRQFDSAILRATIGCFISSNEMRCSESTSNQAIWCDPMIFKVCGHDRSALL